MPPFKVKGLINLYGDWEIGEGTELGANCSVAGSIGSRCSIQENVKIPHFVSLEDNVFIGADVVFTNDKYMNGNMEPTLVGAGAKVGANSTIGAGLTIGKNSIIGMGSVVTKSVPDGETWCGNPARKIK